MGFRENMDYDLNQRISSHRAFLIVLVLSFLVACYSVITARRFMDSMQTSVIVNANDRYNIADENGIKNPNTINKPITPAPNTDK